MLSFFYYSFETLNVLLVYSTHHESNDIECYLLSSLFKYTLKVQELILTADGLTDVMLRWVARLRIFLWSQSFLTGYRGFLGQIVWFTWLQHSVFHKLGCKKPFRRTGNGWRQTKTKTDISTQNTHFKVE